MIISSHLLARQVVKIVHNYHHTTSIFDDFEHYEKKEEDMEDSSGRKVGKGMGELDGLDGWVQSQK